MNDESFPSGQYADKRRTSFFVNVSDHPSHVVKLSMSKQSGVLFPVIVSETDAARHTSIVDGYSSDGTGHGMITRNKDKTTF
jgi:hypothetical protein